MFFNSTIVNFKMTNDFFGEQNEALDYKVSKRLQVQHF